MRNIKVCETCPYLVITDKARNRGKFGRKREKQRPFGTHMCVVLDYRQSLSLRAFMRAGTQIGKHYVNRTFEFGELKDIRPESFCQRMNEQNGKRSPLHKMIEVCKGCEHYRFDSTCKTLARDPFDGHKCVLCSNQGEEPEWVWGLNRMTTQTRYEIQPIPKSCPMMLEMIVLQEGCDHHD